MVEREVLSETSGSFLKQSVSAVVGGIAIMGLAYAGHILTVPVQEPQAQEEFVVQPAGFIEELIDLYKIDGVIETVCPEESSHYNPALCQEKKRELADHLDNSLYMRKFFMNHP